MMKTKIFVIFHDTINLEYYHQSLFEVLWFVNVKLNNTHTKLLHENGYNTINLSELTKYQSLGKEYTESEVIYNIYKNDDIIKEVNFIGFVHHDMNLKGFSIQQLNDLCKANSYISFDQHSLKSEYLINYLMDSTKPNTWIGKGKNCYVGIIDDFNKQYKTNIIIENELERDITLCCAFLLSKQIFLDLMKFISPIIESKKLNIYDIPRKYRMQGGLMERYIGIWLCFSHIDVFNKPLEHYFYQTRANRTLFARTKHRIFKYISSTLSIIKN